MKNLIQNRREFLEFMGRIGALSALSGCAHSESALSLATGATIPSLRPSARDALDLAPGLSYRTLIMYDTMINRRGQTFGYNNDYTAFLPTGANDGLLWVNHEYINSYLMHDLPTGSPKSKKQVDKERRAVGGSILRLQRRDINSDWQFVPNDALNRRVDGTTRIPFVGGRILGSASAVGTIANCAGGITPWKTILTCEENYDNYYGETVYNEKNERILSTQEAFYKWHEHYPENPENYGWVVEVDPQTGASKKLLALGRFAHEGATAVVAPDGRCVVYMGDDKEDECVYKFISKSSNSLHTGDLYVADLTAGEWKLLDREKNPVLKSAFKSQTDLLIQTRKAARLVGGTLLNRPEDIEIDPKTKAVIVAATNNIPKNDWHGSLLKLDEENQDPTALRFKSSTFMTGGKASGFTCPDNLIFDKKGNLWITTDIAERLIRNEHYRYHGNNALYYVPLHGPQAGQSFRIATAPVDAEFTGPSFDAEFKTLFLSVQHPGASSGREGQGFTSNWPRGANSKPLPSVVTIRGPLLDRLMADS